MKQILFILSTLFLLSGCSKSQKVSSEFLALGTVCRLNLYGAQKEHAETAKRLTEDVHFKMSLQEAGSEINKINSLKPGEEFVPSVETYNVLLRGLEYSEKSGGAFDITIAPLVRLWGISDGNTKRPSDRDIEAALKLIDYRNLHLKGKAVSVEKEDTAVDLGAIAKGYAVDLTVAYLRAEEVERGLINYGGNIYAMGKKPDNTLWRVGIQNPETPRGEFMGILSVEDKSVVTSGKYERFFMEKNVRYHHILHPKTGMPVENGISSVTVISDESITGDALSTAVLVLGTDKGLELIEKERGAEVIILTEDKKVYLSSGVSGFHLTDDTWEIAGL